MSPPAAEEANLTVPLLLATSNEQLDGSAGGSSDPAGVQPASLVGAGDMERSHSEAVNGANGIPIVPASEPPMSSLHAVGSGTASPPEDSGGSRISFPPSLNRWLTQTTVLQEDTRSTDSRSPRPVSTVVSEKELEAASPVWDDVTKESKTADRILYADASATMLLPEKSASNASGVDPHKLQTMNSPSDANLTPGTPSVPKTTAVHARDSQKNAKLLYLEGLRGIAALVVAVHHYKQGSFRNVGFWWAEESFHRYLWHILWDGTFSVTVFYVLSGRVLTAAFYARKGPIQALSSAVIRRPFRLAIPVAMAMAINLILGYSGAYDLTARAARIMHSGDWLVNANKYYLIKNAGDYFIALVNMFQGVYKVLPVATIYPCGVIWTIPIEWLGSLFVYLVSFMMVHIPHHRYYVFFVLWFVLWWTMNWNGVFALGLLITDLSVSGYIARWREWKHIWIVQLLLVAIFFLMLCVEAVNEPIDSWTLSWQLQDGKLGGSAPWDQPKTTLIIAAVAEIMLVELSGALQWFFSTWPFVQLGKFSFGIYLMHGMILYSVATRLWVSFFDAGLDYWSIVVAAFIPYILITFISAWFFYYLFDKTSISAGHSIYRWLFVEEWTLENLRAGLGRYAQGWRDWAAERREEVQVLREKVRPNFSSSLP